jgi:hypothetical protein
MLWFIDFPSLDGLRLFAERVLPAMRSAGQDKPPATMVSA